MRRVDLLQNRTGLRGRTARAAAVVASVALFALGRDAWAQVDLSVSAIDDSLVVTNCVTLSATGTLSAIIDNSGAATAGPFSVLFFEDRDADGVFGLLDNLLGVAPVAGLSGQTSSPVAINIATTLQFWKNPLYAIADSGQAVAETDESNNQKRTGDDCLYYPPVGTFDTVEEWSWAGSGVLPDHDQVMMTPLVVNLTDDNGDLVIDSNDVPDVVFSCFRKAVGAQFGYTKDGVVRAVSGSDGTDLWTTPLSDALDVNPAASLAAGDLDGDGLPEIIALLDPDVAAAVKRLLVFGHDGVFKFSSDPLLFQGNDWGGVSIADLNGDGSPEIIHGVQVFNAAGIEVARYPNPGPIGSNGPGPLSTVADIDLDGRPEIVAGLSVYSVTTVGLSNTITGLTLKWQARAANGSIVPGDGFPGVANFDQDDEAEVVVVTNGNVWLFDTDGSYLWGPSAIPGGGKGGAPNIDDFDNDGVVEVGTAGGTRYVVFDNNGTILWQSVTQDASSNVTGSSVFDFEKDGSAEVIYKDENYLRIYRGSDGLVLKQIPSGSGTTYENPVVADVDGDGNAEIVVCSNDYAFGTEKGIQVYGATNDNWVDTRGVWNQHAYHITNVTDDAEVPALENANWLTFNSFRSQEEKDDASIFGAPNLTASFLTVINNCPQDAVFTIRVGNAGANQVGSGVDVAFYNGDPLFGGTLFGVVQTTQSLAPGEFEDVSFSNPTSLSGVVTVCAVVDDDGLGNSSTNECDETDNMCCRKSTYATYQPGSLAPYGCGANPPGSLVVTGVPEIGNTLTFFVNNPIGTQPAGSPSFLIVGFAPDANYPCGTPGPSSRWGMYPTNSGEILVDFGAPYVAFGFLPIPATFNLPVPNNPAFVGVTFYAQGFVTTQSGGTWYGPTNGVMGTLGGCKL